MTRTPKPAVFVDRDGTLNEMVYDETHGVMDSPFRPEHLALKRQAGPFVRALNELGFLVIVVSNQPGLAKGTLTPLRLDRIHQKLRDDLAHAGARVDGIYYCPHHPDPGPGAVPEYTGYCECRKPEPGLLFRAADDHGIDMRRSILVGDGLNDVEAGRAAGVTTILVSALKPEVLECLQARPEAQPDHVVRDLNGALTVIRSLREESVHSRS